MSYLYFINPGEIDIDAAMTMGVNAKVESSAIGYFGTGLKYAIAVLLRHGAQVTIYSGDKGYAFGAEPRETRGVPYTVVTMNGQPLGFTTDLGKNWELWMAYRELRCNCTDENGFIQTVGLQPLPGQTVIAVHSADLLAIHREAHKWFLASLPLEIVPDKFAGGFPAGTVEIHSRDQFGGGLFYKGVRVGAPEEGQLFTYNFTGHVKLTEDRSIADSWNVKYRISQALAVTSSPGIMSKVLANADSVEHKRVYWSSSMTMSPAVKTLLANFRGEIKGDLKDLQVAAQGPKAKKTRKSTTDEADTIIEARNILRDIGINITETIRISDDLGEGILGMVHESDEGNEIWLTAQVLVQGPVRVASTILEEHLHIKHGFADCTREFQNYLLDLVVQNSLNCLAGRDRQAA